LTVTTRTPGTADAEALAALSQETFRDTFAHMTGEEDMALFFAAHKTTEAFARDIADPGQRLRIAEADGVMIGYCKIGLDCDFEDWPAHSGKQVALKELYIRSGHQGKGVAQRLMDWALDVGREAEAAEMVLTVWSGNHRAQAFYRKYGFDWVADTIFMTGNQRDEEYIFACKMG
jgi:diamine N-acetyltransferase